MATNNPGPPPLQSSKISEDDGNVTYPWSRWFLLIWNLVGGGMVPVQNPVVLRLITPDELGAYSAATGELLGIIPLENQPGGAAQPVAITGSPQVFTAPGDGTLVVFAAKVELSRDNGVTWYIVTLNGGAVPMLMNDQVRVTWFSTEPPTITYFPSFGV